MEIRSQQHATIFQEKVQLPSTLFVERMNLALGLIRPKLHVQSPATNVVRMDATRRAIRDSTGERKQMELPRQRLVHS